MAPKSSSKIDKFFGLDLKEMIKNACSVQNTGRLHASEWKVFWMQIKDDPKQATELLGELIERMMNLLEPKPAPAGVSLESLANSIYFMTLFTEFKAGDAKVKGRLGQWKVKEKDPDFGRKFPASKQVMVTLTMKAAKEDLIDRLMISAYTLGTPDDFKNLLDVAAVPTVDPDAWKMSEGSFSYPYLKRICEGDRKMTLTVLNATLTKMTSLPPLSSHRRVAEVQLLALFHMLKNFIALAPVYDKAFLAKATTVLTTFFFWPQPYGGFAQQLLMIIQKETVAPGSAMRARLQVEFKKGFTRGFASEDGQEGRPCYMVLNDDDAIAKSFALTLDVVAIENKQAKKAAQQGPSVSFAPANKTLMCLSMLRGDLGGDASEDVDYSQFRNLCDADVTKVYRDLEGVLEWIPQQTPFDAALEIRKKGFGEIKAKLKTMAMKSQEAKKPAAKYPKSASRDPVLPPIVHFALNHKCTYKFTSKDEVEIMCLDRLPFPETPMLATLQNLLTEHDPLRTDQKVTELRFAVTGGDRAMHSFLCSYLYIRLMAEESMKNITFKFYLLPAARSSIGAFLSRHDAWYNRHVYLPFRTPNFIVPWLNCDEQGAPADQESAELHPPAEFYRRLVEDYLREAENQFHFNVYKIEAWTPADVLATRTGGKALSLADKKKQEDLKKAEAAAQAAAAAAGDLKDTKNTKTANDYDTLIPFMQRIEFGLSAHAERCRANSKGKIAESVPLTTLLADKAIQTSFVPADVRVKFVPVDMKGVPVYQGSAQTVEDDPNQYTAFSLSSVPAMGDRSFPADPSAPWLEMFAQPFKNVKVKGVRGTLLTEPRQHVNSLEVEAVAIGGGSAAQAGPGGPRFDLMVDGQLFGPFYKIRITPHTDDKTKKPITFPIQTFFDV